MEDQLQSTLIDPPRGRTMSPSPLVAVSISKRSRSADSPPPETPRYKLWNEGEEEEEDDRSSACSVDSASTDLVDDEGFKVNTYSRPSDPLSLLTKTPDYPRLISI